MRAILFLCFQTAMVMVTLAQPTARMPLDADSMRAIIARQPSFGIYKDNYLTVGTALGSKPNEDNSSVKFQISIRQRLNRQELPWHSYLYLFYSQKAIWNVFQESLPMHDLNFNPGIGWTKMLIRDGKVTGSLTLLIEHESNGRDGDDSRSWNKIGASFNHYIDPTLMLHAKAYIPVVVGKENKDILDHIGYVQGGLQKMEPNGRWVFDVTLAKRKGWNLNFNTTLQFALRLKKESTQYLFFQFFNGYGECLLDYNRFASSFRFGMIIRPSHFSVF